MCLARRRRPMRWASGGSPRHRPSTTVAPPMPSTHVDHLEGHCPREGSRSRTGSQCKRRLRLIAAHRDVSIRQYVVETIEKRLAKDWAEMAEQEGLLTLTAQSDPVLAELWDNEKDAAYDGI